MNLHCDVDFINCPKNTVLLDFSITSDDGKKFYLVFPGCNDQWLEDRILQELLSRYCETERECGLGIKARGNRNKIFQYLKHWLCQFETNVSCDNVNVFMNALEKFLDLPHWAQGYALMTL